MTDTLKVGHADDCAIHKFLLSGDWGYGVDMPSCSGPPVCQYADAQELAAEVKALRLDSDAWTTTANQVGDELMTLRRLAGEYLKATMVADDPKLDLTNAMHAQETVMDAGQALAAHLEKEKP